MAYESVDKLQKMLAQTVFTYATDRKKAAGRALGTLVEMITFYLLRPGASVPAWPSSGGFGVPEPGHHPQCGILLHPVKFIERLRVTTPEFPITPAKIFRTFGSQFQYLQAFERKGHQLLSSSGILRNACVLGEGGN